MAKRHPKGTDSSLVIIDMSMLIALVRSEDPLHPVAAEAFSRLKRPCRFAVCEATLERLAQRLEETRLAVRVLEAVAPELYEAEYEKHRARTLAPHFVLAYRNSYDAFVLEMFTALSDLIRDHSIEILPPPRDAKASRQLTGKILELLPNEEGPRAAYVATLLTTAVEAARDGVRHCAIWTLHPSVAHYELVAKLAGLKGVSLGVGSLAVTHGEGAS